MILVDTYLLIHATFTEAPEHPRARAWLEARLAEGDGAVVLCWPVLYAASHDHGFRRFGALRFLDPLT